MTTEKIDEIARKFSTYCGVAQQRYDGPKYVFAALLTMLDLLEGKECWAKEDKKESMETIPSPITILGVVPQTDVEAMVLKDLVHLGCESLEEIKGIRSIIDSDCLAEKYYLMAKSRLAKLPDSWNKAAIVALSSIMRAKKLTLQLV